MKDDLISRQEALNIRFSDAINEDGVLYVPFRDLTDGLKALPSVQPTLFGYSIEHLELIAYLLQKENLPPERVAEALNDISRIVEIVSAEFEETLRKAVEKCKI